MGASGAPGLGEAIETVGLERPPGGAGAAGPSPGRDPGAGGAGPEGSLGAAGAPSGVKGFGPLRDGAPSGALGVPGPPGGAGGGGAPMLEAGLLQVVSFVTEL